VAGRRQEDIEGWKVNGYTFERKKNIRDVWLRFENNSVTDRAGSCKNSQIIRA